LKDVAKEIERHTELGPGTIHAIACAVQRRLLAGSSAAAERAASRFRRRMD
jgi:hypothetical protein